MNTLIYLAGNFLRIFAIAKFLGCFFDELNVKKYIAVILYAVFFIVNSGCYLLFDMPVLNLINNVVFIFLITLLYQSKISKKILAVLFVYLVCMATDITADKIRALLNLDVSANGTFGVVVSDLLMLIIVGFASKKPYLKSEYHIVFFE
jgi:hypothetical protein